MTENTNEPLVGGVDYLAHLVVSAVTLAGNIRRTQTKAHCKNGHELTTENVRHEKSGRRSCRACARKRSNAYYARKTVALSGSKETAL